MKYKGLDFSADLVICYSVAQKEMCQVYPETDFGPHKKVEVRKAKMNDSECKRRITKL